MSLRERAAADPPTFEGGIPCSVATALAKLEPDDVAWFDEWASIPAEEPGRRPDRKVAEDITAESGVYVSRWAVGWHRRGDCRCHRTSGRPTS